jgi:hypothetical protein
VVTMLWTVVAVADENAHRRFQFLSAGIHDELPRKKQCQKDYGQQHGAVKADDGR